jgi:hypothetical protein
LSVSGNRAECIVRGGFDGLIDAISESRVTDLVSAEPTLEEFFLSFFDEPTLKALPS